MAMRSITSHGSYWRHVAAAASIAGTAVVAAGAPAAAQNSVRVGFVNTFSGPTAVIGNDARNSFELALGHLGRKMGGLPVEVTYEDDQIKPEVGQKTEKLIQSDHVNFLTGYIWSNVLLASRALAAAPEVQHRYLGV